MRIYPATDISKGKCVRLYQGRADRETVFSDDPAEMAKRWVDAGAEYLHVVDLDGAFSGEPKNLDVVRRIAALGVPVQLGGGIRREEHVDAALESGCARVIVGTRAIGEPEWFEGLCAGYPGKIVASVDARGEEVAVKGWVEGSGLKVEDVMERLEGAGPAVFIYTDISRDGTLEGPNVEQVERLAEVTRIPLIAAGGMSTIEDVKALSKLRIDGVIIGKALYTGGIDLGEALEVAGTGPQGGKGHQGSGEPRG